MEGYFIVVLYFISLRGISISMVCAYIRRHTYESTDLYVSSAPDSRAKAAPNICIHFIPIGERERSHFGPSTVFSCRECEGVTDHHEVDERDQRGREFVRREGRERGRGKKNRHPPTFFLRKRLRRQPDSWSELFIGGNS